jgi:glycosyltransferase involved in cell wall biosynthesis
MSPYVTVLMPVYNSEMYIKEAVDSILNQTFRDFELLIEYDDSTDRSLEILNSYSDPRIYIKKNKIKKGLVASLNEGLKLARGKYIIRMDADDISLPDRLYSQVDFMDVNPEISVCGTWLKTIGDKNEVWTTPRIHDDIFAGMLFRPNIHHPTVIIRKDTILNLQEFYNDDFKHAEDMEYWIRLANLGVKFANIEKVLLKYRLHETNVGKIHNEIQKKNSENIRWMQLRHLGIEPSEEEMLTYNILMNGISSNPETIEKVSQLIMKIQEANKKIKIFSNPALSRELARNWFRLCSNSSFNGLMVWALYFGNPMAMKLPIIRILIRRIRFYWNILIN